jgi:hypothetical protein
MNTEPDVGARRPSALAALRQYVRPRAARERCELCDVGLEHEHAHLLEVANRRLVCACDGCVILFSNRADTKFRRVPRRLHALVDFRMSDESWDALQLPINLAFFAESSAAGRVIAFYPSPAGAVESLMTVAAWQDLVAQNPELKQLEPDVEALLVNRTGTMRAYYRAGIDECFKLIGVIRTQWRGLSGGAAVWDEIDRFFAELKRRSG